MKDEQLYSIALTRIPGLGLIGIHKLVDALGSATAVFRNRKDLCELVPGISPKQIKALDCPEAFRRAEEELLFTETNRIRCLTLTDEDYPSRLRECDDAPLVLYYRGNADLNALKIINIVGTRHATVRSGYLYPILGRISRNAPGSTCRQRIGLRHRYSCSPRCIGKPPQYNWSIGTWSGPHLSFCSS